MKKFVLQNFSASIAALLISVSCFAQDSWIPVVTDGFGNNQNHAVKCLTPFKGALYAGVGDQSSFIFRTTTGNPGSWTTMFSDGMYSELNTMATSNEGVGYMYVSNYNSSGGGNTVFSTTDGISYYPYFQSSDRVNHIVPYKGTGPVDSIYLFDDNYYGTKVFRSIYNSNDPLDTVASWDTVFDFGTISMYTKATSTIVYGGELYAGTNNGAQLWKTTNGTNWVRNDSVQGFGNPNNQSITALGSFGGYLYVGTANNSDGPQIWRSNDGTTWAMVAQYSGYNSVTSMITAGGYLWIGLASSSNHGMIVKTNNGTTFTGSNSNGFGYANDFGNQGNMAVLGNNLYYGCENFGGSMAALHAAPGSIRGGGYSSGGQIWRSCLGVQPVVNLGSDQTVCNGIPVTFTATGTGVSYQWSMGDTTASYTATSAGTYYCIVTGANGCVNSDTVVLSYNPSPSLSISAMAGLISLSGTGRAAAMPPPTILCKGDSIDVHGMSTSNLRVTQAPIHSVDSLPILDLTSAYDTIAVTGINDYAYPSLYSVTIDSLYHTWDADLSFTLYAPDGSNIQLSSGNGNSNDNYMGTVFSMDAVTPITSGTAPFTGTFTPQYPFYNLSGMANGNWALQIADGAGGDQGVLKGWTIRFSLADTILTFSWTPAMSLTSSSVLEPTIFTTTNTVYAITATNDIGCSTTDSLSIVVPHLTLTPSQTVCFGKSTELVASGGGNYYWTPSTDLNTTIGDTVLSALSGSRTYYVNDTVMGCALLDSVVLTLNPALTLTSTSATGICYSDTIALTANGGGGSGTFTYVWYDGASTYPTQNISVIPTVTTTYTVDATDGAGCVVSNTSNITVNASTDIYGHVSYSGGSVVNANAVIYHYLPYLTQFDTIQTVAVNAVTGDYHFTGINHGTYLIEIFANGVAYPTLIPTYYGNVFLWDSATVVTHDCAMTDTLDITMAEESTATGPGLLVGQILEGPGFAHMMDPAGGVRIPGDPVPGIDVKLGRNPGGQLVTNTTTDGSGVYTFTGVAYNAPGEHYTVYVDIPGLGRDSSYSVVVDAANDQYLNLDYYVDSTVVYIVPNGTTSTSTSISNETTFSVYPNPAKGNATVEYTVAKEGKISLNVYNVLGVKVAELVNAEQTAGSYKVNVNAKNNSLNSGVYFIALIADGKTNIHKIVITE